MRVPVFRILQSWVLCGVVAALLVVPTASAEPNSAGRPLLGLDIEWGGEKVRLKVPVGDVALLSRQEGGELVQIGLLAQSEETVALARVGGGDVSEPQFLEHLSLEPYRAIDALLTPIPVKVTLLGTSWQPDRAPTDGLGEPSTLSLRPSITARAAPVFQKDRCCVTCGSVKVCGCAVTMSCGSCCSGACCE